MPRILIISFLIVASCQEDAFTTGDPCTTGDTTCSKNADCISSDGSAECQCSAGYSGDGINCTNIDECADGTHNCHKQAICTDVEGGFSCECRNGFSGDGIDCVSACTSPESTGPFPRVHSIPVRCPVSDVFMDYVTSDVAISQDVLVVGFPSWLSEDATDHSSALLFQFDGSQWQYVQELLPAVIGEDPGKYGQRVEISRSGDTVVVASQRDAFVFRRTNGRWSGGEQLLPSFEPGSDTLLATVATTDQHTALAYYSPSVVTAASVYLFEPTTQTETARLAHPAFSGSFNGNSVSIDGDLMTVANRYSGGPEASVVYRYDGSDWLEEQELPQGSDATTDGTRIIAYGYFDDTIFIYENSTSWTSSESVPCEYKRDFAVFADRFVTSGAPGAAGEWIGSIFEYDGETWNVVYTPEYEAYRVDITGSFSVMAQQAFYDDPVQVVQFADYF